MALTWSWNGKIGEAVFDNIYLSDPTKELTIKIKRLVKICMTCLASFVIKLT